MLQTQLGFGVAVVQAHSYRSDLNLSLGTSICHGYSPKKTNKKKDNWMNVPSGSSPSLISVIPGAPGPHSDLSNQEHMRIRLCNSDFTARREERNDCRN